jgi:ankyrin repeat protein
MKIFNLKSFILLVLVLFPSLVLASNKRSQKILSVMPAEILFAAQEGQTDILEKLLLAKGNPNTEVLEGLTPIYLAAQNGHHDVITLLLSYNAAPDTALFDGTTPKLIAQTSGHTMSANILETACAKSKSAHNFSVKCLLQKLLLTANI